MEWLRSAHDHPLIDPEARDAAETCLEYQLGRTDEEIAAAMKDNARS